MEIELTSNNCIVKKKVPELNSMPEYISYNGIFYFYIGDNKYKEINGVWKLKD